MILVIVDADSKYIDAHVMTSSNTAAKLMKLHLKFATHGLPCTLGKLHSQLKNSRRSAEWNGVKHIRSVPYHPASNGLAERDVQTLEEGLKKTKSRPGDQDVSFLVMLPCNPPNYNGSDTRRNADDETPTIQT